MWQNVAGQKYDLCLFVLGHRARQESLQTTSSRIRSPIGKRRPNTSHLTAGIKNEEAGTKNFGVKEQTRRKINANRPPTKASVVSSTPNSVQPPRLETKMALAEWSGKPYSTHSFPKQ